MKCCALAASALSLFLILHTGAVVSTWEHAAACPWFRYRPTVTRAAEDDPWSGRRGRVDRTLLAEGVTKPPATRFFACGPAAFVKAMLATAADLGVPADRCLKEQWG